jgi:hypothetical protein
LTIFNSLVSCLADSPQACGISVSCCYLLTGDKKIAYDNNIENRFLIFLPSLEVEKWM